MSRIVVALAAVVALLSLNPFLTVSAQSYVQQRYTQFMAGTVAQGMTLSPKGGWVYYVGTTNVPTFTTTLNAFDRTCGTAGDCNPFVSRFGIDRRFDVVFTVTDAAGVLQYSTFLGGEGQDDGPGIAVARDGTVWIAGRKGTTSLENAGPGCNGAIWIARFDFNFRDFKEMFCLADGSISDMVVDDQDHLWVLGTSGSTPLATRNAFQPGPQGQLDIFLGEFVAGEPQPRMLTYLGGSGLDLAVGLAMTPTGSIAVTGYTNSPNFPLVRPVRSEPPSSVVFDDAVVLVLDRSGKFLQFSTQWGGSRDDRANGIAVDRDGNIYVGGTTSSSDIPTTAGAVDPTCGLDGRCDSNLDAFAVKFSPNGELLASTYYGASATDFGRGIAWRPNGQVLLLGGTQSPDFPLVDALPFQRWHPAVNFETSFLATMDDRLTRVIRSEFIGDETYLPNVPRMKVRNNFAYIAGQVTTFTGAPTYGNYLTALPLR